MKYIDRDGCITKKDSGQDRLLRWLYTHRAGRLLLKPLVLPAVSKAGGLLLSSRPSGLLVGPFVKRHRIDLKCYESRKFDSYNSFFTRKILAGQRPVEGDEGTLISPCDGKLSVYSIGKDSRFSIKHTEYTLEELLHSRKLSSHYQGGTALIFRLTVDDYHRYCYMADGKKSDNYRIPGIFHTVNPIANELRPIYKENTREFTLIKTSCFKTLLVMEVGALLVGRITNLHGARAVKRGEEKGYFEFGGSSVVALLQKDAVRLDGRLAENTKNGYETIVRMGERLGVKA